MVNFRSAKKGLRIQYVQAFVITWVILGNALADVFASGRPVNYGYFMESAAVIPSAGLMDYLKAVDEIRPL